MEGSSVHLVFTYLGPPNNLKVYQGSAYTSTEMQENVATAGITLREAPIESPAPIRVVECYQAPLRAAFDNFALDLVRTVSDSERLDMALFAVNSVVGPEGLCPILLVYGALPRPVCTLHAPTQAERTKKIEETMIVASQQLSKRLLAFALRHPSVPKGREVDN